MSNLIRHIALGSVIAIGLGFASAVYAEQSPSATDQDHSMRGMPSDGMGMGNGMMPMMGTMGRKGAMMDGCNGMMQSQKQPPNSQFRRHSEEQQRD